MPDFLRDGDATAARHILLAHGAGAPMTSPFMTTIASLLAREDFCVWRFEFDYMASRRRDGKRRPPPKAERLAEQFADTVAEIGSQIPPRGRLLVGGKSMGGRVASLMADALLAEGRIRGLVCLGYPFHPPGKPDALRTAHLAMLRCPTLIVQGERDPFGTRSEVEALVAARSLSPAIEVVWAVDGDHDLGPRGGSGTTRAENLRRAAEEIARFARRLPDRRSEQLSTP